MKSKDWITTFQKSWPQDISLNSTKHTKFQLPTKSSLPLAVWTEPVSKDYYCLISTVNDRICSTCGASFRNFTILPGKGEKFFFGKMDTFVSSNRYASKQIHVCIYVHTHYVWSVFWGADYIAKIWNLLQFAGMIVLTFHYEKCPPHWPAHMPKGL